MSCIVLSLLLKPAIESNVVLLKIMKFQAQFQVFFSLFERKCFSDGPNSPLSYLVTGDRNQRSFAGIIKFLAWFSTSSLIRRINDRAFLINFIVFYRVIIAFEPDDQKLRSFTDNHGISRSVPGFLLPV